MEYKVDTTATGLKVSATVPAEQQAKLLEELGKCAAGTCACPSTQYEKLASIDIQQTSDGVSVDLKAKAGENIDPADVAHCLEHTAEKLKNT